MQILRSVWKDVVHLFYPHVCTGCGSDLVQNEALLCYTCNELLPQTFFARHAGNSIEKIFWGRLALRSAWSEFYFSKDSLIQHLIHELKYKNNPAVGVYLGSLMGKSMRQSNRFDGIDLLVPLPLFAAKQKKRGYNQSEILCKGMAAVTGLPVINDVLIRKVATSTQTKKHRTERWDNVKDGFAVLQPDVFTNKHILLVDDVITTGATLEACGMHLLNIENVTLSIATLATAVK